MRAALFALALAGCFESQAPTCTVDCANDDECPSGLTCNGNKCSVDGASCVDARCTPDTQRCGIAGNTIEVCEPDGNWTTTQSCPGPCVAEAAATPTCRVLVPSISVLARACETTSTDVLVGAAVFSTTMDAMCTGGVLVQQGGPGVCVVRVSAAAINTGSTLRVLGTRALAIVADGDILIGGTIDVSAGGRIDGPGGGGVLVSGTSPNDVDGGGGAGFQTAGGTGGQFVPVMPPAGGASVPYPAGLLVGGYRASATLDSGGGGGGALALISCRGTVSVSGALVAGGGGGLGGLPSDPDPHLRSGAGGGSGGVLLLQGIRVAISPSGGVYANGGGGGGGGSNNVLIGGTGLPGGATVTSGGGGGTLEGAAAGGRGGFLVEPGAPGEGAAISSGGGGGGVGYIFLSTPQGTAPVNSGQSSPAPILLEAQLH